MRISDWSSDVCSSDLIADRLDLKAEPREGEGVAGGQRAREIFLDPAQSPPVSEAYVGHRCLHDDSGIEPVLRRELRVRNAPDAMPVGGEEPEAVIAFERIAAVAHETAQAAADLRFDPELSRFGANLGYPVRINSEERLVINEFVCPCIFRL